MTSLWGLLRQNRNYRYTWMGQVVSEIGDWFNNIAVFALVMEKSGSGLVVSGVMLARAIPAVVAGPIAGVLLDRLDRKRIMIASDLIRAAVALAFVFTIGQPRPWLLYALSAVLMFASPFFTSGRAAILPTIASDEELHTANSLTQTTAVGHAHGGHAAGGVQRGAAGLPVGVHHQFAFLRVLRVDASGASPRRAGSGPPRSGAAARSSPGASTAKGWPTCVRFPLMMGIAMISVGWAMGGGAAQILFALFGEQVFHRGAGGHRRDLGIRGHRTAGRRDSGAFGRAAASASPGTSAP